MSKSDRNNPRRSSASESRYTIFEFEAEFPDDAACLDYLVAKLYPEGIDCPKCERVTKHHRIKTRTAYSCQFCGHYEYPMKGTIFEGSSTSLRLWFYAIHLMASTRGGISAKQLERELGVTYKCAWRMFNKIRSLLGQDNDGPLSGNVEIDEMYVGPKAQNRHKAWGYAGPKQTVFGMMQRAENDAPARVVAVVVPDNKAASLMPAATMRVLPATTVFTDELQSYHGLSRHGYRHQRVAHTQGVYVDGNVHTNTLEGFWSLVKRGIGGTYHAVSTTYLQSYLDEYAFRYNNRAATGRGMFDAMLDRIEKQAS